MARHGKSPESGSAKRNIALALPRHCQGTGIKLNGKAQVTAPNRQSG
jgi:hypothetical protein